MYEYPIYTVTYVHGHLATIHPESMYSIYNISVKLQVILSYSVFAALGFHVYNKTVCVLFDLCCE